MDNMDSLKMDEISRNRIISDMDNNFFVEAGAGSGKTTMLVNRMVSMIEQGRDIRQICAITFTKAAANEFRGRFQKILLEEQVQLREEQLSKNKFMQKLCELKSNAESEVKAKKAQAEEIKQKKADFKNSKNNRKDGVNNA